MSLDWQYSHAFASHKLTGGLFAVDEDASSVLRLGISMKTPSVRAVFMQDQLTFGRHKDFARLRLSDHENIRRQTTWNVEYAYRNQCGWTINAGLGHAFRAPDATDRFGFGGNLDLRAGVG